MIYVNRIVKQILAILVTMPCKIVDFKCIHRGLEENIFHDDINLAPVAFEDLFIMFTSISISRKWIVATKLEAVYKSFKLKFMARSLASPFFFLIIRIVGKILRVLGRSWTGKALAHRQ